MSFEDFVSSANDLIWGPVMLVLLVGTGIFLTIRLKGMPWRNLGFSLKHVFKGNRSSSGQGDISPFQSLMTALAATIGTGNIAGVATAMVAGGPGALFWMWLSAVFGLSTKYAECTLAVKYREVNATGEMAGGPMYVMKNGIKTKWFGSLLAFLFSLFAVFASFGIGNLTQVNAIAGALKSTFGIEFWITGIVLLVATAVVILGGIKSIGRVSSVVVPVMAIFYILFGLIIIFAKIENLPAGIAAIFESAFNFEAIAGGGLGFFVAMRYGVARGVFSNEAGLGSAPIAAAAGKTDHPCRQGYISMTGTFFDTIIVCTITGLAIACSGVLVTHPGLDGIDLTIAAFSSVFGKFGAVVISIGITLFAYSTILGWAYYGEKSFEFLTGTSKLNFIYRILFCGIVFLGSVTKLKLVWNISDAFNGLMAIPNLICLLIMSSVLYKETRGFQQIIQLEKQAKRQRKRARV